MAKIGLNYGEKLQIADKTYCVITDGLDVPAILGKLTFRGIEGPDVIFEVDQSQRNPDGSFVQVNLLSSTKHSFSLSQTCQSLKLKTWALNTEKK